MEPSERQPDVVAGSKLERSSLVVAILSIVGVWVSYGACAGLTFAFAYSVFLTAYMAVVSGNIEAVGFIGAMLVFGSIIGPVAGAACGAVAGLAHAAVGRPMGALAGGVAGGLASPVLLAWARAGFPRPVLDPYLRADSIPFMTLPVVVMACLGLFLYQRLRGAPPSDSLAWCLQRRVASIGHGRTRWYARLLWVVPPLLVAVLVNQGMAEFFFSLSQPD